MPQLLKNIIMKKYIYLAFVLFFSFYQNIFASFDSIFESTVFFEKYNISSISIYVVILYILVIFSFLFWVFYYKWKNKKIRFVLFWILFWIFYGFIIEKNLIFVEKHKTNANFNLRMWLISDVHVSFLKNKWFLKRVVDRINEENLDVLLVAWDWTFFITEWNHSKDLKNYLAPLKNLQIPTFGIIGNHDVWLPWPPVEKELIKTLKEYGIILLDNNIVKFPDVLASWQKTSSWISSLDPELPKYRNYNSQEFYFKNNSIYIVWLWEFWQWNANLNILKNLKKDDNTILLIHNPDILKNIKPDLKDLYDFAFAGHLHGGQIRLPFIYKFFLPTDYDFDDWFYDKYKLFITSWIWEVGILARFFNPPKIDIFEF